MFLKHRHIFKEDFYSIEDLEDYLTEQGATLTVCENIESSQGGVLSYIGDVHYPDCYGYSEALYAEYLSAGQIDDLRKALNLLAEEFSVQPV